MKIKIEQKNLSKHISIAQKSISNRSTLQILDGLLLNAKDNKLKITGTDLEISIETYVSCQVEEEGAIVINSRIFGDIIRKLPATTINITVGQDNMMNIVCGNSEFNIQGNNPEEYPNLPIVVENKSFNIAKDIFKKSISQTVFATSQDETRPALTGVLMELGDKEVSFVALDGYRLALKKIGLESDLDFKMIVPGRALVEINRILDEGDEDLNIISAPGNVVFNIGDTRMYSRLLDGQFFNYRDIIRKEHETTVKVNRRDFQLSLERASLLAKEEKANLIKLSLVENKLIIESNSEIGNVHEEIDVDLEGQDVNIAFNSRYLLEGIKVIESEEIELNLMGSLNPCIIKPIEEEEYIYLVLPVRLAQ